MDKTFPDMTTGDKSIGVDDDPPFTKEIWLGDGGAYIQVEVGHYPDGSDKRSETYARRVYADDGGPAVIRLLEALANISVDKITLPVWKLGAIIAGARRPCPTTEAHDGQAIP